MKYGDTEMWKVTRLSSIQEKRWKKQNTSRNNKTMYTEEEEQEEG